MGLDLAVDGHRLPNWYLRKVDVANDRRLAGIRSRYGPDTNYDSSPSVRQLQQRIPMARISPKSPRYRTKQQLADDVAAVLKSSLHYGTKFAVLKEVTWVWTESSGKFIGCPYWTDAAVRRFKRERSQNGLRHEHVVPKKVVIDMLLNLEKPTPELVRAILDKYLIGVVVTKEEDVRLNAEFSKTMPEQFGVEKSKSFQDPWLRYRNCGIKVRLMPQQTEALLKHLPSLSTPRAVDKSMIAKIKKALNRHGWIDSDFDWTSWKEAEDFVRSPELLEKADVFVIQKLFTMHVRKEHFCEGHFAEMFANGHMTNLMKRLKTLRTSTAFD